MDVTRSTLCGVSEGETRCRNTDYSCCTKDIVASISWKENNNVATFMKFVSHNQKVHSGLFTSPY